MIKNVARARFYFSGRKVSPIIQKELRGLSSQDCKVRCLDLGCGDGVMIKDLYEQNLIGKNIELVGLDVSEENIKLCRRRLPDSHFVVGKAEKIPFKDKSFDFIYSWMVIEHICDPRKMVTETARLLKDGGKCYISSIIKRPWAVYFYRRNGKFVLDPTHINEFDSEKSFLKLFKAKNVKIVDFSSKLRIYSILELFLKILIKLKILKSGIELRDFFVNNKLMNFVKSFLIIPVPGFYQVEVLYEKNTK